MSQYAVVQREEHIGQCLEKQIEAKLQTIVSCKGLGSLALQNNYFHRTESGDSEIAHGKIVAKRTY